MPLRVAVATASLLALSACHLPRPPPPIRADTSAAMTMFGYCADASANAGMGPHMMRRISSVGERSAWLADARREIAITSEQDQAWSAYAAAMDGDARAMDEMGQRMIALSASAHGPDRLEARVAAMSQRLASLEQLLEAERQLYAALTPPQRETADIVLAGHCW